MENQAEAYEALWKQPPACLSDPDIFERRNVYDNSKTLFLDSSIALQQRQFGLSGRAFTGTVNLEASQPNSLKASGEPDKNEVKKKEEQEPEPPPTKRVYNYEVNGQKIRLTTTSCFLFTDKSFIRKILVYIVLWKYSDLVTSIITVINAVLLGVFDFTQGKYATSRNIICSNLLLSIKVFFVCEALMKMIAVGLAFARRSYLRDPWNWLDLGVVSSIIFFFLIDSDYNWTILRIFRLLAVLRRQERFPKLQYLVATILKSLIQVLFVLLILFIIILIFAIVGKAAFAGVTHSRCQPINGTQSTVITRFCGGGFNCPENFVCVHSPTNTRNQDIQMEYANFDNIGTAMLTIFQVASLEGWEKVMHAMQDGYSKWFSTVFYVVCTVICGCFTMNLALPILRDRYFNCMTKAAANRLKDVAINKKLGSTLKIIQKAKKDESKVAASGVIREIKDTIFNHFVIGSLRSFGEEEVTFRKRLGKIAAAPLFNTVVAVLILFNDAVQATNSYPDNSYGSFRQVIHFICLGVFLIEVCIRVVGVGKNPFFQSIDNILDLLIICASFIHSVIIKDVSPILCLRTLRIFSLLHINRYMKRIANIFAEAILNLCMLCVVLFIFLYVYAIIGSEFFAGRLRFNSQNQVDLINGEVPRENYDTLLWALITTFKGFMGDTWQLPMYLAVKALGWQYTIYHITLWLLGKILLYHLFVAVLLSLFRVQKTMKNIEHKPTTILRKKTMHHHKQALRTTGRIFPIESPEQEPNSYLPSPEVRKPAEEAPKLLERHSHGFPRRALGSFTDTLAERQPDYVKRESLEQPAETRVAMLTENKGSSQPAESSERQNLEKISESESGTDSDEEKSIFAKIWDYAKNSSLFIFHRSWCFRVWLTEWVIPFDDELYYLNADHLEDVEFIDTAPKSSPFLKIAKAKAEINPLTKSTYLLQRKKRASIFETCILVLIILSILTLIFDSPLKDPKSGLKVFCSYANIFFTYVFSLEALLKIIAMGFFSSSSSEVSPYMASGWNVLDFFVVVTSLLNITNFSDIQLLKTFKAIRALRVLRPLKMSTKSEQLKLLVTSLTAVIPNLVYLLIITTLYVFSVGIIATYAFKGKLYHCTLVDSYIENRAECEDRGGTWEKIGHGFDNIGGSLLSLIQMITCDGWGDIMLSMIDARGPDLTPKRDHNPFWALFAIAYMLVGAVALIGMYICILFECYNAAKLEYCGAVNCNLNEQQWINIQRFMLRRSLRKKVPVPTNGIRFKCFEMAESAVIHYVDMLVVLCVAILYSLKTYNSSVTKEIAIDILLYVCTVEMNVICFIKLLGYGSLFFQSVWNQSELVVLLITDVGLFLHIGSVTAVVYAWGNALRLIMLAKLFQNLQSKKIKVVIDSIVFMIPSLFNIAIMVFILLLIYALLGVDLFWSVKYQGPLNENSNFRSFEDAIVVLIQCATGENWNAIMFNLAQVKGDCALSEQTFDDFSKNGIQGCGTAWAYPYFLTFTVLVTLTGMNLFSVIVIESYLEAVSENYSIITADQFEMFLEKWSEYDPEGTGWISVEGLIYLMFGLNPPLGIYDQKLRVALWDSYLNSNKKKKPIIVRSKLIRRLISQIDINEEYLMHKYEPSVIERRKVLLMLKQLQIPLEIGTWRVHLRDVCQRMTIRAISNKKKEKFEVHEKKAKLFFKQEWLKKFPEKRKRQINEEIYTNEYWAGHLVYRIFKQKIEKRKERDEKRQIMNRVTNVTKKPLNPLPEYRKIRTRQLPPI